MVTVEKISIPEFEKTTNFGKICLIGSLIKTCAAALVGKNDGGANVDLMEIENVLNLIHDLLPFSEMERLDELIKGEQ